MGGDEMEETRTEQNCPKSEGDVERVLYEKPELTVLSLKEAAGTHFSNFNLKDSDGFSYC
jgi:hypothetical protein